jgi:AcrR family transcriptional regulator
MARQYVSSETRQQQIAEAALWVLAEAGVGGFTTRAIAARVGVTDGTLFRHFADKQAIVLAAMDLLEEGLLADLQFEGDPIERLEAMFRARAVFVGSNNSVGRLIFSEQLVHLAGDEGRARVSGWRTQSVKFLFGALQEARAAGHTPPGIEPAALAQIIQGVLLTFALRSNIDKSESSDALRARVDAAWTALRTLLFR